MLPVIKTSLIALMSQNVHGNAHYLAFVNQIPEANLRFI